MTSRTASLLWQRLDSPGHDACRLVRTASGWRLEGMAVYSHDGTPAQLAYRVDCDAAWHTEGGGVQGWIGGGSRSFEIQRTSAGLWTLNGAVVPGLEGCTDLDLGFTPATNLLPLRRLALKPTEAASAPAAWFDVESGTLDLLPQRYERRSEETYWYEAPSVGYAALLEVDASGFVRRYPGLWETEA